MRVILSAAVSIDGYLDDSSTERLKLSSDEDWAAVEALRGECDAILVGAGTIRKDNPSLVIKSDDLRRKRLAMGMSADIVKVTVTASGYLDATSRFFTQGDEIKLVFASKGADANYLEKLSNRAEVVIRERVTAKMIVEELSARGYDSLMVEGGTEVLTMFLEEGFADEFRLAVAPFFVGDSSAPRLVGDGDFVWNKGNRMELIGVEMLGDMAVMNYRGVRGDDAKYLQMAIDESRKCIPSDSAYCVGAVIVTLCGDIFTGYTHQTDAVNHAEEEAVAQALSAGADLSCASIYSSMEPCSTRRSKPRSCTQLIIEHGFSRVVYALAEPSYFVDCCGDTLLRQAGIEVVHIGRMGGEVERINGHLKNNEL